MRDEPKTILIEDGQLIFKNFSGKEGQYNREGDRNFSVILPMDDAVKFEADGWNVRYLKPQEEGDDPTPYLSVAVNFRKGRPPKVVMMTSRARTYLSEDEIEVLDWANIEKADLIVRAYEWTVNGKSGIKAYLQSLFVTIEEDALERKYAINELGT